MWEQISNYLKNAEWDFWAVVLAVIAILVTIIIYWLQRNKKELVLEIIANTKLLADTNSQIKVFFGETQIKNPSILILKLTNTSKAAIGANDFETPFVFTCPKAKILEVNSNSIIKNLQLKHQSSETEITIEPLLLNPKDSFTIKILLDNSIEDDDFNFSARIKDIKEIKRVADGLSFLEYFVIILVSIGFFALVRITPDIWLYVLCGIHILLSTFFSKRLYKQLSKLK